ncbi:RNA-binding protein [Staphylococcus sp. SQ8-PEA]|uniref:RNA-binding protein n=1 Tax=Staphylococcus marylandisciuri TaxID=2981529 RepID=A0ABT2QP40_9STAP|nr:RNA-binding protein [Staphylococcus marylandisciuri]MCU5745727.1 RNA-binding protein [Staphylococcus marylandisciuri]
MSIIDIYQHFRPEEKEIIDQLLDKCKQAQDQYAPVLTHFLDPRGQYIGEVVTNSFEELHIRFYGGKEAERKRAIISPSYFEPEIADYEISLIELTYPTKFVNIQHQHVLGTIMSLGVEREKLGDIVVDSKVQFTLTKQLESYIMMELTHVKGASVKLNSIPLKDMIQSKEEWKAYSATVSALRLDVVLKEMIRKSRSIAKQLIERKKVKVNHVPVNSVNFQLDKDDVLSIQGFGRARITEIGGKTKKDKLHIKFETLFK